MRWIQPCVCIALAVFSLSATYAQGGLLKKIKQKAESIAGGDKKTNETQGNQTNGNDNNAGTGTNGRPSNKSGQGLITTPPNVNENLTSAETSFKASSYGDARYAIQQAMLGVELEIGQKILKSLPPTVAKLPKDSVADQVVSTGWGWAGLTIHREYTQGDKQMRFTVANNSVWMNAVNMYLTNGAYAQQSGNQQNWKQTKLKGHRAVIEYNDRSGYKLSVPLGQTSLVVFEGVNFTTEQDFMNAASEIDIESIKKNLGEK